MRISNESGVWDNSNDYSYNYGAVLMDDGELVYGVLPDGEGTGSGSGVGIGSGVGVGVGSGADSFCSSSLSLATPSA